MAVGYGHPAVGSQRGRMRAADADRDRVAGVLGTAYSEGRLSKDEYDTRLGYALSARTYGDLDSVVTDLPVGRPAFTSPVLAAPRAKTNVLAVTSLACGVGQFMFGPLATIPAIVLGHMARREIKRTGEQGAGMALAGLLLGWGAVILLVALITILLVVAGRVTHSAVPAH
jgi:hypothetical protein